MGILDQIIQIDKIKPTLKRVKVVVVIGVSGVVITSIICAWAWRIGLTSFGDFK